MDPYRDQTARCPRCGDALEHRGAAGCKACGGLWLGEGRLDAMLREMHDLPIPPVFVARAGAATLPCATCGAEMAAVVLEGVEVDRCARGHGVWFDARELEAALRAAADADHQAPAIVGVPSVRIGLGRAILGAFGELLKILGYGAVGMAGGVLAVGSLGETNK